MIARRAQRSLRPVGSPLDDLLRHARALGGVVVYRPRPSGWRLVAAPLAACSLRSRRIRWQPSIAALIAATTEAVF